MNRSGLFIPPRGLVLLDGHGGGLILRDRPRKLEVPEVIGYDRRGRPIPAISGGAFGTSGLFVANHIDVYDATQLAVDLSLTSHKIALYNNTKTPNYSTDVSFNTTNEVTGTGWASGGVALSAAASGGGSTSPTLTESPTGTMMYDMADVAVSGTTLTNARGCEIYADALAGDNLIVGITFGSDFSTVAGIFGIQWSASGVFTVDWTP